MGYIHDVNMSKTLGPEQIQISDSQAWTDYQAANIWSKTRAAGATTFSFKIPVLLPQNSVSGIGSYLRSIDLWYKITTDPLASLVAVIYKETLPADSTAFGAPASQAFTYDATHAGAPGRVAVDEHKMTLTITTPFWLDDGDEVYVMVTAEAGATPVFSYFGARLTYTLRL